MRPVALAIALLLATSLVPARPAAGETYAVDPAHTSVLFHVRHLFTAVTGRFHDFDGSIELDPENPTAAQVKGTIRVQSVDTGIEKRDNHLRAADFFDVGTYPTIEFASTEVAEVAKDGKKGRMLGTLTIRDVTRVVSLDVEFLGVGKDPWGKTRAGFRATTTIDRKDFGLRWNQALETGGFLVGDEVRIELNIEAILAETPPDRSNHP